MGAHFNFGIIVAGVLWLEYDAECPYDDVLRPDARVD